MYFSIILRELAIMSRVLVVDDNRYMAEVVAIMLMCESGYDAITAFSGYDALAKLRRNSVDLVITDLRMPGMDGFALIESMRQKGKWLPIIIVTAFHTPEDQRKAEQLQVFAYLTRPFDNDELKNLVRKALEHDAVLKQ